MPRNKIYVNIYNEGKLFGIKTPAYNIPMDYGTYQLLLEMGCNIEISDPRKKIEEGKNESSVVPKKHRHYKKRVLLEVGDFVAKENYEEKELIDMSKLELIRILNYRGHYSSKTGKRDSLAPKYDDNKTILISKIIKTNLK